MATPCFDKWEFVNRIGVDTCAYCNRNYIFCYDRNAHIKPQIDHFFPQYKYPFLGVTYFNLIPSCEMCNGIQLKGKKDIMKPIYQITNPYLIDHNDFHFKYDIVNTNVLNTGLDINSISVYLDKCPPPHETVFKLGELYSKHTDHVLELIFKGKLKYNRNYRDYVDSYKGLNLNDDDINRLIVGNYTTNAELHKRPLSKLFKNIAEDLDLIPAEDAKVSL